MALVDHHHGGATLKAIGMATGVQHKIFKKRFERLVSKLQTEGTRRMVVLGR